MKKAGVILCAFEASRRYYLLVQTYGSKWGFPKGTREPGETGIACAIRECKEETGLRICLPKTPPQFKIYQSVYYYCTIFTKKVAICWNKIDPEITGIGWFCESCVQSLLLNADARVYFKHHSETPFLCKCRLYLRVFK